MGNNYYVRRRTDNYRKGRNWLGQSLFWYFICLCSYGLWLALST